MRQRYRIERSMHLGVIIEIDKDVAALASRAWPRCDKPGPRRRATGYPGPNLPGPFLQSGCGVATDVEFDVAMQADIDEVARGVLHKRPLARGISDHQGDIVFAQQAHEILILERGMSHFER